MGVIDDSLRPMTIKSLPLLLIALFGLAIVPGVASAQKVTEVPAQKSTSRVAPKNQLAETRSDLISATETYKASAQEVVRFQEQEISVATKKLEDLRQLVADGLVARHELTAGEQELAAANARLESTKKQIADSDNLISQITQAEEAEKMQAKLQAGSARKLVRPTSMRYHGMAGWALANIGSVQSFFTATFGRALPISTFGQSGTHNAMGWDHRNSVDVGLHPDSTEGRALTAYLQSKGIPFLAFRGAIPGVSTGPHIHIGYPSSRLS
jgi:hypothetical protein